MYCPVCFNDTLKLASSGVAKLIFNGKSKATSQFFYNLTQDKPEEINDKLKNVIKDYFIYYSGFQNKDPIRKVEVFSIDFKCKNGCIINVNHRVNVIGLLFEKEDLEKILKEMASKYQIPMEI